MFQDHLVLLLYWNIKILYEIKIMKTGLSSMCFISVFQIFPDDNHNVLGFVFNAIVREWREALAIPTHRISNNSFHPFANVNCHPWFTFINQNGKCMWNAESGSWLLSENVINHHWLAFWVKLHKNVEKQMLAGNQGKEVRARRLAF